MHDYCHRILFYSNNLIVLRRELFVHNVRELLNYIVTLLGRFKVVIYQQRGQIFSRFNNIGFPYNPNLKLGSLRAVSDLKFKCHKNEHEAFIHSAYKKHEIHNTHSVCWKTKIWFSKTTFAFKREI